MSVEEVKEKNQHIADRMNATGMDVVEPLGTKKSLLFLVPITSIFVLSSIIATFFMESIFNLLNLNGIISSTILPNPDFKILLYLSIAGIVGIHRNRGKKLTKPLLETQ